MRILIIATLALCWCCTLAAQNEQASDAKSRKERLITLQNEITKATAEAQKKIAAMTDATEKRAAQQALNRKINEMRPKVAAKSLALAKENPKDDIGLIALIDAYAQGKGTAVQEEAYQLIAEYHYANPKIEPVLPTIGRVENDDTAPFLKKVMEKNPSKTAKAIASLYLAKGVMTESESAKTKDADIIPKMKEALSAYEKAIQNYGELKINVLGGKVADLARREIEQIKKSPIGKPSPDIKAEDIDGINFKLSDYRGKVILLDFWGHW